MAIACQNPFYSSLSSSPSSSSLSSSLSSQFSSLSSLLSSKRGSSAWISMSRHRVSPLSSLKLLEAEVKRRTAPSLEPYMNHIQICNSGLEKKAFLLPFVFDGQVIGYIHPKFAEHLGDFEEVLDVDKSGGWRRERLKLRLNPSFETREERSDAMDYVAKELHKKGLLPKPHGERYAVSTHFDGETLFSVDRNYAPYFGIQGYAVHVNGFVKFRGEERIWVGKRSMSKSTYPGLLDQLVAGGLPMGLTCKENVIKECWEEAGIPHEIASTAVPVSVLSYEQIEGCKFERYVLFCYDLHLPLHFLPQCNDGEMECFKLMSMYEVQSVLERSTMFKPSCAIVTTDFLIRHGMIKPEQQGYVRLLTCLGRGITNDLMR